MSLRASAALLAVTVAGVAYAQTETELATVEVKPVAVAWNDSAESVESEEPLLTAHLDRPSYATTRFVQPGGSNSFWQRRRGMADKHAPAGIMGDHVHEQGEFMAEYKYMNMYMNGNRTGTRRLSDQQALTFGQSQGTNFGATPTDMTMEMHMLHFMRGVTDDVTAYAMINLPALSMNHITGPANPQGPGVPFSTHNSGIGDTRFGALVRSHNTDQAELIWNLGFSIPTGDISRRSSAPTGGRVAQELPYPMRLGSGSFAFRPGVTYKRYYEQGSFGSQFQTNLPLGPNWDNYTVSDTYRLNQWYSHLLTERTAASFRVENLWRSNFEGADPELNPRAISTARPDMRGGYWLSFGYGISHLCEGGSYLNFEITHPVYQFVDGVQLETDWSLAGSWSKAF